MLLVFLFFFSFIVCILHSFVRLFFLFPSFYFSFSFSLFLFLHFSNRHFFIYLFFFSFFFLSFSPSPFSLPFFLFFVAYNFFLSFFLIYVCLSVFLSLIISLCYVERRVTRDLAKYLFAISVCQYYNYFFLFFTCLL